MQNFGTKVAAQSKFYLICVRKKDSMFSLDNFINDCKKSVTQDSSHLAVKENIERAISSPKEILKELGEPKKSGVKKLYVSDTLTILNLVWAPMMTIMPHNHQMWAVIGIYSGREDNTFWRRIEDKNDGRIEAAGAKNLGVGDVTPLGKDIIHSVTNPIPRFSAALHVYGGNFFQTPRSEGDAETLVEKNYDVEKNLFLFKKFDQNFIENKMK